MATHPNKYLNTWAHFIIDDIEYIDSEIQKFAKDTVCYELRPEHITGKIVNES